MNSWQDSCMLVYNAIFLAKHQSIASTPETSSGTAWAGQANLSDIHDMAIRYDVHWGLSIVKHTSLPSTVIMHSWMGHFAMPQSKKDKDTQVSEKVKYKKLSCKWSKHIGGHERHKSNTFPPQAHYWRQLTCFLLVLMASHYKSCYITEHYCDGCVCRKWVVPSMACL